MHNARNDRRQAPDKGPARLARKLIWPAIVAGVPLVLGALAGATGFQERPAEASSPQARAGTPRVRSISQPRIAAERKPAVDQAVVQAARNDMRKLPLSSAGLPVAHRSWGPPLSLSLTQYDGRFKYSRFDPRVREQQQDLLDLGFDLGESGADGLMGARTRQALDEFRSLYVTSRGLQSKLTEAELASLVHVYAQLARDDASRFRIDRGVLAAIRLSSVRSGVEFSFLMELAAVESNFNPAARAVGSSALGLYQFTKETWLHTLKAHGARYGLGPYVAQIEYYVDRGGNRRPMVRDPALREHLLDLRLNPRVAAMMAAESVKDYADSLASVFDRKPARADLYLTHFFGTDGAIAFLKLLDENPGAFAIDRFPEAAANNRSIFHHSKPRTVNQVYEMFRKKFDTSRYETSSAN